VLARSVLPRGQDNDGAHRRWPEDDAGTDKDTHARRSRTGRHSVMPLREPDRQAAAHHQRRATEDMVHCQAVGVERDPSVEPGLACSQVSCAVIQKGGPCYYPDNPVSRAAVVMNLYYAYSGRHP
jgi:hypothetical protein